MISERMAHDIWCLLACYYSRGNVRRLARKIAKRTKYPELKRFCDNLQTAKDLQLGFTRLEEAWLMWYTRGDSNETDRKDPL